MADRLLGYPSKITVSGNVVTWAADEYDKILMDTFTTSNFVYNLTTGNAQPITTIGGQQLDGTYDITVTDASTWTTGDRSSPMADNGGVNYLAMATLFSAAANADRALVWAAEDTVEINGMWNATQVSSIATTKVISVLGMLPKQRVKFFPNNVQKFYFLSGSMPNVAQQKIENISISCWSPFYYLDSGTIGGGYRITRCRIHTVGITNSIFIRPSVSTPNVVQFDNCMITGGGASTLYVDTSPILIYNNTIITTTAVGVDRANIMIYGSIACTLKNNIAMHSPTANYGHFSGADNRIMIKNISEDATGNIGYQNKTFTDIGFLYNNSNDAFVDDFRLISSSAYAAAGDVIAGIDFDIDGNDITVNAPIGCSAGIVLSAMAPNPPILNIVGMIATISNSNLPTDKYSLLYNKQSTDNWNILGSRIGDGIIDFSNTYLPNGIYNARVISAGPPDGISAIDTFTISNAVILDYPDLNWDRWIFASICQHFEDRRNTIPMYVEGTHRDTKDLKDFFELRVDGPWYTEISKDYWNIYVEINVLVQSTKDHKDFHRLRRNTGIISRAFTDCIRIFKYGNGIFDDQKLLDNMKRIDDNRGKDRIQTSHFGQIEPMIKVEQATIEAHYVMNLAV